MSQVQRSSTPPRSTHSSYHPGGYGVSEGLKRARRPYLFRNAVTGSAILAFATGVYFYSLSKVKQDDFSDLAHLTAPNGESATANAQAKLKETAGALSDSLSSAAEQAQRSLHSAASTTSKQVSRWSASTADQLSSLAEQAQAAAAQARESASGVVEETWTAFSEGLSPRDDERNRLRGLLLQARSRQGLQ